MSESIRDLHPKMLAAIAEMKKRVRARYPDATFDLAQDDEDPSIIHLITVVDVEDPDEVTDLVIDRMGELLVDEGLPLYVIPIRAPDRVAAMLAATRAPTSQPAPRRAPG
jgi:hypothetical protein